ncbi:MAG: hypothetical protein V3V20_05975 [Algisphaera sp.]
MKHNTRLTHVLGLALCAAAFPFAPAHAQAQTVDLYDGPQSDSLFGSSPAGFKYLDFSGPGVINETGSSFTINAEKDSDGSMGIFGIVGRNLVGESPATFEAEGHLLRVEYKFLEDNQADKFILVLTDKDGPDAGEQYKFFVKTDTPATETTDGFSELLLPISETDADQRNPGKDAGFPNDGDGIANYDLTQWQIQSVYGSTTPLNVEIRQLQIIETPDP